MSLAADDPRHGTVNGYRNIGCRCDACRIASREYDRANGYAGYKRDLCGCGQSKSARSVRCQACEFAAREAPHGTETRSRRCRCQICRTAAANGRRRRRHATREPCSHGCGTMVDTQARRNPGKPLECLSCATKRRWAEYRAAKQTQ